MRKIKNIVNSLIIVNYPREYKGAAYSICNFKRSVPKKTPITFHNRYNIIILS